METEGGRDGVCVGGDTGDDGEFLGAESLNRK